MPKPIILIKKDDMGHIWLRCEHYGMGDKVVEWHFTIELSKDDLDSLEKEIKKVKEQNSK